MQQTTVELLLGRLESSHRTENSLGVLLTEELARCKQRLPDLRTICVSTADGRPLAELESGEADARRIAAMANSFLTLGETLAKELKLSGADYATVCTSRGNIVLFRIDAPKPLTLLAMAGADTNLALLLVATRDCAARIGALLARR